MLLLQNGQISVRLESARPAECNSPQAEMGDIPAEAALDLGAEACHMGSLSALQQQIIITHLLERKFASCAPQ